jgi:Transposase DDE domain
MFYPRTTKTASGAIAVQVVRYVNRKMIVVKHIGSVRSLGEVAFLKQTARNWIEKETQQQRLFPLDTKPSFTPIEKCVYLATHYSFIYEVLAQLLNLFHFDKLNNQLLLDLVIMRIIHPVSKLESLEYLSELFGIVYKRGNLYREIASFSGLKKDIEKEAVTFAKQHLRFDFSIVFYDVTTLYFESFKIDEDVTDEKGVTAKGLRKNGFSKDNKANQPQIVIGLIVTKEGFPVAYDVFEGNTFEGKTFIPSITKFKNTYAVTNLTVVADAAMISYENVQELIKNNLSYIVGARMANIKPEKITEVSTELVGKTEELQQADLEELAKKDGSSIRIKTERGLLICDFSLKRYRKDKREMEKQIVKAEKQLEKKEGIKRTKFLKNKDDTKTEQILNTALIAKTKLLLGIKGYYTNLIEEANKTIIDHYHTLWHVEHAFRIAKSDLAARPIFHHKREH